MDNVKGPGAKEAPERERLKKKKKKKEQQKRKKEKEEKREQNFRNARTEAPTRYISMRLSKDRK